MPSVRDLVAAIRQRDGVDAAIILGPDGLVIHGDAAPEVDGDALSARVPALLAAARGLAGTTQRGDLFTAVLEHEYGVHVLSVLSPDAILVVLITPDANLGDLLFDLRRNRQKFASVL